MKVNDYKYLGSYISSTTKELSIRKALAYKAFWNMKKVWFSKEIPIYLKIRMFKTLCLSILLYGCETWIMTKDMINKLDSFAMKCYRIILGIKYIDKFRNSDILNLLKEQLFIKLSVKDN